MLSICETQSEAKSISLESDSIRNRLIRNKQRYELSLKNVNDALEALDKNPELANLLELIKKAS